MLLGKPAAKGATNRGIWNRMIYGLTVLGARGSRPRCRQRGFLLKAVGATPFHASPLASGVLCWQSLAFHGSDLCLPFHVAFSLRVSLCPNFLFLYGTRDTEIGPPCSRMTSPQRIYMCNGPASQYGHVLRYQGGRTLTCEFGGYNAPLTGVIHTHCRNLESGDQQKGKR